MRHFGLSKDYLRKFKDTSPLRTPSCEADTAMIQNIFGLYHNTCYDLEPNYFYVLESPSNHSSKLERNIYMNGYLSGHYGDDIMISINNMKATPIRDLNYHHERRVLCGMRYVIAPFMSAFLNANLKPTSKCSICNCSLLNRSIHVDHCGEMEYRHIVDQFIIHAPDEYSKLVPIRLVKGGTLANDDNTKLWITIHNTLAQYQLTCANCNLTKSKK